MTPAEMNKQIETMRAQLAETTAQREKAEAEARRERLTNALIDAGVPAGRVRHAVAYLTSAELVKWRGDGQPEIGVSRFNGAIVEFHTPEKAIEAIRADDGAESKAFVDLYLQSAVASGPAPAESIELPQELELVRASARRAFEKPPTEAERKRQSKLWADIGAKLSGRSLADLLEGATVETDDN